jgi:hypothetical protein
MGSKKYPDENEYDAYLTAHGGASNACTEQVGSSGPAAAWRAAVLMSSACQLSPSSMPGIPRPQSLREASCRQDPARPRTSLAPAPHAPQECTTFHFDVQPAALHGALDRFAQFFIAPLVKQEALSREVQAVDNEFSGAGTPAPPTQWPTELPQLHTPPPGDGSPRVPCS